MQNQVVPIANGVVNQGYETTTEMCEECRHDKNDNLAKRLHNHISQMDFYDTLYKKSFEACEIFTTFGYSTNRSDATSVI